MNDMTNYPDDLDDLDFSREEELFRAALDRHALDIDEPVSYEAPRRQGSHQNRWLAAVAAASVAAVGGWWALQPDATQSPAPAVTVATPSPAPSSSAPTPSTSQSTSTSSTSPVPTTTAPSSTTPSSTTPRTTASSTKASSTPSGTASNRPKDAPGSVVTGALQGGTLPSAASGWLWWSAGRIAVQTPQGWLGGDILCVPDSQADGPMDDGPFVSRNAPGTPECAKSASRAKPQPYVSLQTIGEGSSGELAAPKNSVAKRLPVGMVSVQMTDGSALSAADRATAEKIIATVRDFDVNADGCPATSPMAVHQQPRPKAWDLASAKVSAMSVCQYDGMGQLLSSGSMTAAQSDRLATTLGELAAAPTGTTKGRASCESSLGQRTLLRATTAAGTRDAYLYNDDCEVYVDDGMTKRQVTGWCTGLYTIVPFALPVTEGPGKVCWGN